MHGSFYEVVRVFALLALSGMCACTTPNACGSNMLGTGSIRQLRCEARTGSKQAAFRLGELYEHGVGVAVDRSHALRWYKQAARDTPGRMLVQQPRVGSAPARVLSVSTGMGERGLPEARRAIERLSVAETSNK